MATCSVEQQLSNDRTHLQDFNNTSKTITWERLELQRLEKLGISNRYSRHLNVLRKKQPAKSARMVDARREMTFDLSGSSAGIAQAVQDAKGTTKSANPKKSSKVNSIAPFATLGKATCGVFFNDDTDNRKRKFGIPPSDLVKWRNFSASH